MLVHVVALSCLVLSSSLAEGHPAVVPGGARVGGVAPHSSPCGREKLPNVYTKSLHMSRELFKCLHVPPEGLAHLSLHDWGSCSSCAAISATVRWWRIGHGAAPPAQTTSCRSSLSPWCSQSPCSLCPWSTGPDSIPVYCSTPIWCWGRWCSTRVGRRGSLLGSCRSCARPGVRWRARRSETTAGMFSHSLWCSGCPCSQNRIQVLSREAYVRVHCFSFCFPDALTVLIIWRSIIIEKYGSYY